MAAQSKMELREQLDALDHLESPAQSQAIALISGYVDFLLQSRGAYLAGPVATPGSSAKTTCATIDCPNCGYKISGVFS
jgi:hypothetical protein